MLNNLPTRILFNILHTTALTAPETLPALAQATSGLHKVFLRRRLPLLRLAFFTLIARPNRSNAFHLARLELSPLSILFLPKQQTDAQEARILVRALKNDVTVLLVARFWRLLHLTKVAEENSHSFLTDDLGEWLQATYRYVAQGARQLNATDWSGTLIQEMKELMTGVLSAMVLCCAEPEGGEYEAQMDLWKNRFFGVGAWRNAGALMGVEAGGIALWEKCQAEGNMRKVERCYAGWKKWMYGDGGMGKERFRGWRKDELEVMRLLTSEMDEEDRRGRVLEGIEEEMRDTKARMRQGWVICVKRGR